MNHGKCTEGWNRYICDCSATSFTGPTCGKGTKKQSFTKYNVIRLLNVVGIVYYY